MRARGISEHDVNGSIPVSPASVARSTSPDYVQSLARGLAVLKAFSPTAIELPINDIAERTGLTRQTARRLLLTLEQLGYVRAVNGRYTLTPQSLELATSYVRGGGLWAVARTHVESLVSATGESSSICQLDGSDIVCIARVSVPKIIAFTAYVGTRFPADATAPGKVLLAGLSSTELDEALAVPTRSHLEPTAALPRQRLDEQLAEARERGWAIADEELSPGLRAVAAPIVDVDGRTIAAINLWTHAAETSHERLIDELLPQLIDACRRTSADWGCRSTVG